MPGEFLQVVHGPAAGASLRLLQELEIGRAAEDMGSLGEDPELSRRHARIVRTPDGGLQIEDLGSTNGTFVNGAEVTAVVRLQVGDMVEVGGSRMQVVGSMGEVFQPTVRRTFDPAEFQALDGRPERAIEVEGLVREFAGRRAVDGIELHVLPGEIYGFLGPNGAGKSTTVHMLTTLLPPSDGTARIAGFDIVRQAQQVRGAIGVALQEAALDPFLTAWEHMELQTALQGVPKAERRPRAEALIERVDLTGAADRRVGGYSGGMKRRLDLALALVHEPQVLFLDEPTTGLDPQSRTALWQEVERLAKEEGVTVFLTTQYLEEADLLADRVAIMNAGQIVVEGTPDSLKAEIGRPTVEAVPYEPADVPRVAAVLERFGEPSQAAHKGVAVRLTFVDDLAEIVRAFDAEDLRIARLDLHGPTLDDVFLAKTGRSLEEQAEETEREQRAHVTHVSLPGQPVITRAP